MLKTTKRSLPGVWIQSMRTLAWRSCEKLSYWISAFPKSARLMAPRMERDGRRVKSPFAMGSDTAEWVASLQHEVLRLPPADEAAHVGPVPPKNPPAETLAEPKTGRLESVSPKSATRMNV